MTIRKHWAYLKYVLRHKWFVFLECCKLRIVWRGIIHDWTKLTPAEWNGYVYRFTRGNGYDIEALEYLYAFSHHLNKCRHHWQHWAYVRESGEVCYLPMPEKARLEMLADLRAMSRQHGTDVKKWYAEHSDIFHLHPETKLWLNSKLGYHFDFKHDGLSTIYFECPFCNGYNGHIDNLVTIVNCTSTCGKQIDMYSIDPDMMVSEAAL